MPSAIACGLCGRASAPPRPATRRYCDACRAAAAREVASLHRVKCGKRGRAFRTPNRSVRYCSDACRQRGYAASGSRSGLRGPPRGGTAECRRCGRAFDAPNRVVLYCSDACRAGGLRARRREYMRRCLSDPGKRIHQAARIGAMQARRRAEAARERERRVRCGACGTEFATAMRNAMYCSGTCRKQAVALRGRRRRRGLAGPRRRPSAAHARREFEPGRGGSRLRICC